MKDYKLTLAHYVIHLNERLYARERKGKTKPQEVFLAFLQKNVQYMHLRKFSMQHHALTIIQSRISIMNHNSAFAIGSFLWNSGWMY
jgi:hypothetical protein